MTARTFAIFSADPTIRDLISRPLLAAGHAVHVASNPTEAAAILRNVTLNAVLIDITPKLSADAWSNLELTVPVVALGEPDASAYPSNPARWKVLPKPQTSRKEVISALLSMAQAEPT